MKDPFYRSIEKESRLQSESNYSQSSVSTKGPSSSEKVEAALLGPGREHRQLGSPQPNSSNQGTNPPVLLQAEYFVEIDGSWENRPAAEAEISPVMMAQGQHGKLFHAKLFVPGQSSAIPCVAKRLLHHDGDVRASVDSEIQNLRAVLGIPGCNQILGKAVDGSETYILLKKEGESLGNLMKSDNNLNSALTLDKILEYGEFLFKTVKRIHDKSFVHLDIKPDNVLRTLDGKKPLLCDFGSLRSSRKNPLREACWSEYAPPGEPSGKPCDVVGIGSTVVELLVWKLFGAHEITAFALKRKRERQKNGETNRTPYFVFNPKQDPPGVMQCSLKRLGYVMTKELAMLVGENLAFVVSKKIVTVLTGMLDVDSKTRLSMNFVVKRWSEAISILRRGAHQRLNRLPQRLTTQCFCVHDIRGNLPMVDTPLVPLLWTNQVSTRDMKSGKLTIRDTLQLFPTENTQPAPQSLFIYPHRSPAGPSPVKPGWLVACHRQMNNFAARLRVDVPYEFSLAVIVRNGMVSDARISLGNPARRAGDV
ncbi:kinase-like domain-containing protein [Sphaerosporella brunnea]|uniref:Kinase-like domain-containing protein n=1 Tax=Sphaerosporella brunnea TaxID=1250544 RepID=A0A5J5EL69_9PEZI|nr:kinase-like domain-containing protein [Sphaerosporella brunnea]